MPISKNLYHSSGRKHNIFFCWISGNVFIIQMVTLFSVLRTWSLLETRSIYTSDSPTVTLYNSVYIFRSYSSCCICSCRFIAFCVSLNPFISCPSDNSTHDVLNKSHLRQLLLLFVLFGLRLPNLQLFSPAYAISVKNFMTNVPLLTTEHVQTHWRPSALSACGKSLNVEAWISM